MKPSRNTLLLLVAVVIPVVRAQAPPDSYNPQTRRIPATVIEPSLQDMGSGTDQGNVGYFVTNTDKQYAQAMALRGMMEIQLGQAALEKSQRADVQKVAHRMIADYLEWDAGMDKAARKLGIPLAKELTGKEKAEVDRICTLSGPE